MHRLLGSGLQRLRLRVRLLLLGSATRLRGLRGAARQAPGVKLRPSLGSGENLLMPGAAQGGDRGPDPNASPSLRLPSCSSCWGAMQRPARRPVARHIL
ncbi:Oligophrenin-1 [Manis pentadactyla]|nr:Oligophrenin-1 [Manis pentadactyla]